MLLLKAVTWSMMGWWIIAWAIQPFEGWIRKQVPEYDKALRRLGR